MTSYQGDWVDRIYGPRDPDAPDLQSYDDTRKLLIRERRGAIQKIKLDSGCVDCGYRKHPAALDFDHIDPMQKSFQISSSLGSRSWDEILSEIEKCEVRCANCHRIKTAEGRVKRLGRRPRQAA